MPRKQKTDAANQTEQVLGDLVNLDEPKKENEAMEQGFFL